MSNKSQQGALSALEQTAAPALFACKRSNQSWITPINSPINTHITHRATSFTTANIDIINLNLGQDIVDEVVVVDLGVDALGQVATTAGCDQLDARGVVVCCRSFNRLVLREHHQNGPKHIEL